jgi:hypothetical protein
MGWERRKAIYRDLDYILSWSTALYYTLRYDIISTRYESELYSYFAIEVFIVNAQLLPTRS